jgi:hypothetical protein
MGKKTFEYHEEEKSIEIPLLAASENGSAQTESIPERVWRCGVRLSICDPELARSNLPGKADDKW